MDSNAITVTKTQETSTTNLVYCTKKFLQSDMQKLKPIMLENCNSKNMDNIFKELYKRHIIPFYLPVLILISLIHIIRSKEKINFGRFRIVIFICGLLVIIFSETTLRFINDSVIYNLNFVVVPIFLLLVLYLFILFDLRINFKEKRL